MAWKLLPTDYTDAVWSGLKRYTQVDNSDGTVSFNDVTTYTNKEKSFFGAKDANRMNEALNYIMSMLENGTNLYEEFQTYFTTQKELFKSSGDSSYQELTQYFVNLKAQGDSSLAQIEKTYEEHMTTYEGEQTAAFNTWFAGIKGKLIPFQAYILLNKFPSGKASDSGFQLLKVKWLGKIVICSQIQTVYFIFNLIPGGQDQNRGIGIVLPELAENFQTVRAGKIQIQQNQVIIFCHTQAKPFVSIETDICFITVYAKSLCNRTAELLFVFYN